MADAPISTASFTLTRADALAWERTRFRPGPAAIAGFALWPCLCAAGALLLPVAPAPAGLWTSLALGGVFAAIGTIVVLIGLSLMQWRAAGRRMPRALQVTVTEWPERLDLTGPGAPPSLALRDIREALLTGSHLFLDSDNGLVILPRAAWPDPAATAALAARIAGRAPEPVDAERAPA